MSLYSTLQLLRMYCVKSILMEFGNCCTVLRNLHHTRSEVFAAVTVHTVVLWIANILDKHAESILTIEVSLIWWCMVSSLKRTQNELPMLWKLQALCTTEWQPSLLWLESLVMTIWCWKLWQQTVNWQQKAVTYPHSCQEMLHLPTVFKMAAPSWKE